MKRLLTTTALIAFTGGIAFGAPPDTHDTPSSPPPSTGSNGEKPGPPDHGDPGSPFGIGSSGGGGIAGPGPIATGANPAADGYLRIGPDEYGSWASVGFGGAGDLFNPAGAPAALEATFTAGFLLFVEDLGQRELLASSTNWQGALPADATLDRAILSGNSGSDTNADGVDDTLNSSFRVFGGTTDLRFNLTQSVSVVQSGVSELQQTYIITNDSDVGIAFNLVRAYDGDLPWTGGANFFADDEVGTSRHSNALGRYVFQQEPSLPSATAVTLSSATGGEYYGGKHGVTPPNGPPAYDYGTDTEVYDAFGVPTSWENHIAGVGYNTDGTSGSNPPGATPPQDAFMGLDFRLQLAPGESTAVVVHHTYGQNSPVAGTSACKEDINGDGTVSVSDLTAVILDWNCTDPPGPCVGDVNNDGITNVIDLVAIILAWGPCPEVRIVPPGKDCFNTPCGETTYSFGDTPIPADFFGPGSDPFTGPVVLGGETGQADTIVERLDSFIFDESSLPDTQTVPIELVSLNLTSCAPITVTFNGGQDPESWDVRASNRAASGPGTMTATKENADGGSFDSEFPVHPVFTFVRVSDGLTLPELDPGIEFVLTSTDVSWLQDIPVPGVQCDPHFAAGWSIGGGGEPRCEETCHPTIPPSGKMHCVQPCPIPRECPPGSNYGQRPHQPDEGPWFLGTSDKRPNFVRYDDFPHDNREIITLWFWGADAMFIPGVGFVECNLADPHFNVRIFPDDGTGHPDKGNPICIYDCIPAREKNRKADYETDDGTIFKVWQYKVNFPTPCNPGAGKFWLSIQGCGGGPDDPDNCWFLWLSSPDSNMPGSVFEDDMGVQTDDPFDYSFCINREEQPPNPFGCDQSQGDCCVPNGSPGCGDVQCCRRVCEIDPFCCEQEWDQLCSEEAAQFPQCGCMDLRIIPPGDDCFSTPCGATQFQLNLPPDFFGPGCAPFNQPVQLGGQSGFIDTVVSRLDALVFDESQPLPQTSTVDIEIIQLDLVGCQPIVVDCSGGPQLWQVEVHIQPGNPPQNIGQMVVTKEHPQGGSYDATLPVFPLFTFVRIDGPGFIPDVPLGDVILQTQGVPWLQGPGIPTFTCDPLFGPGVGLDGDGNPCCQESCHENPGGDHLHCTVPPKCQLPPCPPPACKACGLMGDADEGEACGDDTNGGCNSTPPVFGTVACGQSICGTIWADAGMRDTDWFLTSLGVETEITARLTSAFSGVVFIVDGIAACVPVVIGITGSSDGCASLGSAIACVPPGDYVVFVSHSAFDGAPCGTNNEYHVAVTCLSPCPNASSLPPAGRRPAGTGGTGTTGAVLEPNTR